MMILRKTFLIFKHTYSRSNSSDEEVTLCPNNYNVAKDQSQDELIFYIIEKIEEPESKDQCLQRLKNLLLKDKVSKSNYNLLV